MRGRRGCTQVGKPAATGGGRRGCSQVGKQAAEGWPQVGKRTAEGVPGGGETGGAEECPQVGKRAEGCPEMGKRAEAGRVTTVSCGRRGGAA